MDSFTENNSVDYYEKNASVYDTERFSHLQGHIIDNIQKKKVLDLITDTKRQQILDLGCGTGRFSIVLLHTESPVISFDPSLSMLKEIKKKENSRENSYLIQGIGHELPFKANSFDACVCINVFDHISDFKAVLSEVSRILKRDGIFVFNFSNSRSIYFPFAWWINFSKKSFHNGVYTEWQNLRSIEKQINESNMKILQVRGQLLFPKSVIPQRVFRILIWLDQNLSNSFCKTYLGSLYLEVIKK